MKSLCFFPNDDEYMSEWTNIADQAKLGCVFFFTQPDDKQLAPFRKEKALFVTTEEHASLAQKISKSFPNLSTLIVSRNQKPNPFGELSLKPHLNHFLTLSGIETKSALVSSLAQFHTIGTRPILEGFLAPLLSVKEGLQSRVIRNSQDKESVLAEVQKAVLGLTEHGQLPMGETGPMHPIPLCLDEILLNAIFNANKRLVKASRGLSYTLDAQEEVTVSWGFDSVRFGICVSDPFGTLKRTTAFDYIHSQRPKNTLRMQSGGLGFKTLFKNANELVFSVKPGKFTDVFCFFNLEYRSQRLRQSDKSLLFLEHS